MRLGQGASWLRLGFVARLAARRVEALVSGEPFAQMWVAQTLARAGDVEGAVRAACAAEGWPGGDPRGYALMGFDLREAGRAKEGHALLGEAVARGSRDVEVLCVYISDSLRELSEEGREARSLGELEGLLERRKGLVELSERAVELAPERADAHLVLATCLLGVGRVAEAREACERAVALEPDSVEVRRMLREVEKAN